MRFNRMEIYPDPLSKLQRKYYLGRRKFPSRTSCARGTAPDLPPVMLSSHLWRQSGGRKRGRASPTLVIVKKCNRISSVVASIQKEITSLSIQPCRNQWLCCLGNCFHKVRPFRSKNRAGEVQAREETQERSSPPEVHFCRFSVSVGLSY